MNNGISEEKQESSNKIGQNVALFFDNCVETVRNRINIQQPEICEVPGRPIKWHYLSTNLRKYYCNSHQSFDNKNLKYCTEFSKSASEIMGLRLGCTGLLAILVLGWIRISWSGRLPHKVCQTIRYGNATNKCTSIYKGALYYKYCIPVTCLKHKTLLFSYVYF